MCLSQLSRRELSVEEQSIEANCLADLAHYRAKQLNWPPGLDVELRHAGLAASSLSVYDSYYKQALELARTLNKQDPDRIQLTLVGEASLYTWLYFMKQKAMDSNGRARPVIKQISAVASAVADLLDTTRPCVFPFFKKVKKTLATKYTTAPNAVKGRIEYADFIPKFRTRFPLSTESELDLLRSKAMVLACIVRAC